MIKVFIICTVNIKINTNNDFRDKAHYSGIIENIIKAYWIQTKYYLTSFERIPAILP